MQNIKESSDIKHRMIPPRVMMRNSGTLTFEASQRSLSSRGPSNGACVPSVYAASPPDKVPEFRGLCVQSKVAK